MHTQVGIILGSRSEWSTMKHTAEMLARLGIPYEARIVTANRSTKKLHHYASNAINRGLEIFIAGSGSARQLPEVLDSNISIPVLSVAMLEKSSSKNNFDESIAGNVESGSSSMPGSGQAGAVKAALIAARMLGDKYPEKYPRIREDLEYYERREKPTAFLREQ